MYETSIALVLFLLPLAYSPGPGNLFFAAIGGRFGIRAVIPAMAGYHIATFLVTVAIGLGFAGLAAFSQPAFAILRLGGAAYVLWLAWGLLRASGDNSDVAARRATVQDGAVLLLLNPKAYVIIALMFSQFLPKSSVAQTEAVTGAMAGAVLWIAAIFTLNNLLAFTVWALAGDLLTQRFRNSAGAGRINVIFAALLAAVAIWMLLR